MRITKISDQGINLIKKFEGFRPQPYLCPAQVPTIGYGTTVYPNGVRVRLTDPAVSEAEAIVFLRHDLARFELGVDALTRDDLTQGQFDALTSFSYNLGLNALKNSTLLKRVNTNPQDPDIRAQFMRWVLAGGRVLNGLKRRREEEVDLYFSVS